MVYRNLLLIPMEIIDGMLLNLIIILIVNKRVLMKQQENQYSLELLVIYLGHFSKSMTLILTA